MALATAMNAIAADSKFFCENRLGILDMEAELALGTTLPELSDKGLFVVDCTPNWAAL